jgi:hypothetical protein
VRELPWATRRVAEVREGGDGDFGGDGGGGVEDERGGRRRRVGKGLLGEQLVSIGMTRLWRWLLTGTMTECAGRGRETRGELEIFLNHSKKGRRDGDGSVRGLLGGEYVVRVIGLTRLRPRPSPPLQHPPPTLPLCPIDSLSPLLRRT